ncbi:hypothetical protein IV203_000490 [Nitzschia inconspicua]|uniref:Uncharacterized protein n=1 Tax=Nitzschia inconspicua TaxID=303405 RepID=A0A9K3L4X6_9STRA|nr:hypothetical protein IV203_000490 [Nitzschia inconspicua]
MTHRDVKVLTPFSTSTRTPNNQQQHYSKGIPTVPTNQTNLTTKSKSATNSTSSQKNQKSADSSIHCSYTNNRKKERQHRL